MFTANTITDAGPVEGLPSVCMDDQNTCVNSVGGLVCVFMELQSQGVSLAMVHLSVNTMRKRQSAEFV